MVKAVKVLNTVSTLLFITVLLLVYAYLPISVDLNVDGISNLHKHRFFYYAVGLYFGINLLIRIVLGVGLKGLSENLLAWCTSLIFIINVYLSFLIGFVGVWNNATHISPSNYSYLNFLGPIFIIIWVAGLIFLVVKKK